MLAYVGTPWIPALEATRTLAWPCAAIDALCARHPDLQAFSWRSSLPGFATAPAGPVDSRGSVRHQLVLAYLSLFLPLPSMSSTAEKPWATRRRNSRPATRSR